MNDTHKYQQKKEESHAPSEVLLVSIVIAHFLLVITFVLYVIHIHADINQIINILLANFRK